jgi:hypothetical protein
MAVLLIQTILAARNRNIDDNGWVQILVLVVVGVFWVLKALKSKTREDTQSEQQAEEQASSPMRRLHARPPASGRAVQQEKLSPRQRHAYLAWQQQQLQNQPKQQKRTITRPQPSMQKAAALEPRVVEKLEAIQQLDVGDLVPEEALEAPKYSAADLSSGKFHEEVEPPEAELLLGLRTDYADLEQLRRAILHYEILGKPLSLRPPGEQVIG